MENAPYERIGEIFQEETAYHQGKSTRHGAKPRRSPAPFKSYPQAEAVVPLNPGPPSTPADLWAALARRRSRREFDRSPIPFSHLNAMLWAGQGVTEQEGESLLRTAPSAGALYPIETYVCAQSVSDLNGGLYHLDVRGWQLERLRSGNLGSQLAAAALGQDWISRAAVTFVWTAVAGRTVCRYGQRGYRYIYLDAAHIAAQVMLAAEALGLGCCAIAALYDDAVNAFIGVDGREETVVYMCAVGCKPLIV